MQIVDFPLNRQGTIDFFNTYALDYIDEAIAGSGAAETVLKKDDISFSISENYNTHQSNDLYLGGDQVYGGWTETASTYTNRLQQAYICDNAIVIFPGTHVSGEKLYNTPIVLCKTDKGNTAIIRPIRGANSQYSSHSSYDVYPSAGDMIIRVKAYTFYENELRTWTNYECFTNVTNEPLFTKSIYCGRAGTAKDVYLATVRPLAAQRDPFRLELAGERYASFGYNSILVKTA